MENLASYLVSLGFNVNQAEFNNATAKLKEVEKTVATTTASMAKNFAVAGVAIVGAMTAITKAVVETTVAVAENDLAFQKLANRMWMSKDATKEMKMATDALGESIEDIAFTPELRGQYQELIELSRQINTPTDHSDQMKGVRAMVFEFKKLKMEVAYATEWVAYYITKYLGAPLDKLKKQFTEFNDKLIQEMPNWTKDVARVLATVVNIEMSFVRFAKDMFLGFSRFFSMLTGGMSTATKAILGLWAVLKLTPFGWFSMAFVSLIVLIEDFYGYIDGRKSSKTLAPIWQKLIDFFKKVDTWTTETLPKFIAKFDDLIDKLTKLINETLKTLYIWLVIIFDEIFKACDRNGVMDSFVGAFKSVGDGVKSLIEGFTELMVKMGLFAKDTKFKGFWSSVGDVMAFTLKMVANTVRELASFANMLGMLMQGKYKEAGEYWMGKEKLKKWESGGGLDFTGNGGENKKVAWDYFTKMGYSKEMTAGIIGNLITESNLNPTIDAYDNSGSYGIAQWLGGRKEGLYDFASNTGLNADDFTTQLKYIHHELQNGESGAMARMQNGGSSPEQQALLFSKYYERPEWAENPDRQNNARRIYSEFQNDNTMQNYDTTDYSNEIRNARLNYRTSKENAMSSYTPQATASNYQAGVTNINVGDINIAGTNVSATEIQQAVVSGVSMAQQRQTSRNMRDFGGVFG